MGLFDMFRGLTPKNTKYAAMLNGYSPIFSQIGDDIYVSDVVQQALNCIVSEMKKLNPLHVKTRGSDVTTVTSSVQKVLQNPNPLMTTSDFIEKIIWLLFFNYNAFVIPTFRTWLDDNGNERRFYESLYPVAPTQVNFIEDASNTLYVKLTFTNNYEITLPYSDVIHIRYRYSVNEFMGGNKHGQPNNEA